MCISIYNHLVLYAIKWNKSFSLSRQSTFAHFLAMAQAFCCSPICCPCHFYSVSILVWFFLFPILYPPPLIPHLSLCFSSLIWEHDKKLGPLKHFHFNIHNSKFIIQIYMFMRECECVCIHDNCVNSFYFYEVNPKLRNRRTVRATERTNERYVRIVKMENTISNRVYIMW